MRQRQRLEMLLTALAVVAVFAVSATDPWWYENWLRILIVGILIIAAATVGFLTGVAHGMGLRDE